MCVYIRENVSVCVCVPQDQNGQHANMIGYWLLPIDQQVYLQNSAT